MRSGASRRSFRRCRTLLRSPQNPSPSASAHGSPSAPTERPDAPDVLHVGVDGTETISTWAELHRRSSQLAGALAATGVGPGDRVSLALGNTPQFVLATFATWKLGAVPVPVRWDVPEWELSRVLEVIEPRVHLGTDDLAWIDGTADLDGARAARCGRAPRERHLQQRLDRHARR